MDAKIISGMSLLDGDWLIDRRLLCTSPGQGTIVICDLGIIQQIIQPRILLKRTYFISAPSERIPKPRIPERLHL